ncbi:MAG: RNB domain-containing ribonuclease [Anaerolineales bacterium]|nr:RNB domain-containing ribonuclease [Anaerolineales bacterium]
MQIITNGSLVLYKNRPARVVGIGEKLEIELDDGNRAKVRPKDVSLLHPGPMRSLSELVSKSEDVELAWEILTEDPATPHTLAELAELIFGEFTPAAAWAVWQLIQDGLYFRGVPQAVITCTAEAVERERRARQARQAEEQTWIDFLGRLQNSQVRLPEDNRFLREVEDLALGRRSDSRLLRELGRSARPETAHALLLEVGYWGQTTNPYPVRIGLPLTLPTAELPPLADESRLDLTHLPAFAIDDRDNRDPDDAVSLGECRFDSSGKLVGGQLWVHVADAAALVAPGSPADLQARERGATLYLPEGPVPMLPPGIVDLLGMGLQEISPALSFRIEISAVGEILDVLIQPSWVRVQRLSYEDAEGCLGDAPFKDLHVLTQAYQARRENNGALQIDLPEVIIQVTPEEIKIRPVKHLRSRLLVREAMLMAGEAAARFAIQNHISLPFAIQEPPEAKSGQAIMTSGYAHDSLAASFQIRKTVKRSQVSSYPAPHAGVGLESYCRATSPLRRYLDLVTHQQLRSFLKGQPLLGSQEMLERLGTAEAVTSSVTQAEFLSRRHWTLVYLLRQHSWRGLAVLVEKQGLHGKIIIPELALENSINLRQDLPLNSQLELQFQGAYLPDLEAHFQVVA